MFLASGWYTYIIQMFYAIPLPSTSVNQTLTFHQLTLNKIRKIRNKRNYGLLKLPPLCFGTNITSLPPSPPSAFLPQQSNSFITGYRRWNPSPHNRPINDCNLQPLPTISSFITRTPLHPSAACTPQYPSAVTKRTTPQSPAFISPHPIKRIGLWFSFDFKSSWPLYLKTLIPNFL